MVLFVLWSITEPHIEGYTCYGDNVEDEWFIVFLLFELTKSDSELVVKVDDTDGDFLLIEAADYLPKWVDPDTSDNRVFIHQNHVHLIPMKTGPLPRDTPLIPEAIKVIRSYPYETKSTPEIQGAITHRIGGYPEKIFESHHRTKCYVPAAVAALLEHEPNLISAAVNAFYSRDPLDMRACRAMKYFPPENRVTKVVTMTRCMYGQLMGQKYNPDKRIGWDMPPLNSIKFKSFDLGMKIACGFEIIVANLKPTSAANEDGVPDTSDFEHDRRWQRFLKSLESHGYFQGLLEGSNLHKKLLERSKQFFVDSILSSTDDISPQRTLNTTQIGHRILSLLKTIEIDYERLRTSSKDDLEDDDKWMHIAPTDFDTMLREKFLGSSDMSKKVPEMLNNFLESKSGLKGAEVPPVPPVRRHRAKSNRQQTKESDDLSKTSFESENFSDAIRSVLTLHVPSDSDGSSSGMSDYSEESDTQSGISEDEEDELDVMKSKHAKRKTGSKDKDEEADSLVDDMKQYMDQMDRELAQTKVGQTFERQRSAPLASLDEEDEYKEVDVDLSTLKNILESLKSQSGLPGPSSNLLQSMGMLQSNGGGDNDKSGKRN